MPTDLVEPTGTAVKETNIQPSGVVAEASAAAASGTSAADSLKTGMQKLQPAKETATSAQRVSETQPVPPKEEKKEFPPVGESDIKERKQVETRADAIPAEEGSALESFQKGHRKARADKQARAEADENPVVAKEEAAATDSAATPAASKEDEPVTEEEIAATIADPGISKRHQKRMIHLAARAKELEQKLKDAESKPQTDANDAKVKELSERSEAAEKELVQYRRRYSLESEPELKKFDEIATKADEAIYTKLKEAGLSEGTIELVKKAGGFDGFSRSTQTFTINVKDPDTGEAIPTPITASALARQWLNDMNVGDSEYVKAKLGERFNAVDGKKRRSDELAAGAEDWFKNQQVEYQKQVTEGQQKQEQYRAGYDKKTSEWIAAQESLKDKTIPATATPEEKAEIESYNKHNAGVRALIKSAIAPTSLDEHVAIVQEAARALVLSRDNALLRKELAASKAQLERVQKGSTTTGKGGGASIVTAPKKKDESVAATMTVTSMDGLREGMERLRRQGEGAEE